MSSASVVAANVALPTRVPAAVPQRQNQRWSLDFVSDTHTDGRRVRILAIVDNFTANFQPRVADTSLSGHRVHLIEWSAKSAMVVSNNGTELTSMAMLRWQQETGTALRRAEQADASHA